MTECKNTVICTAVKTLSVLAVFVVLCSCHAFVKDTPQTGVEQQARKLNIIGHRGAAGLAPENTLSAFARACEIGVDAVEFDILLTADRKAVVYHDFSLKPELTRTPDGKWLESASPPAIKDLRLVDLKTYDVGRLKPGTRYSRRYPEQTPVDGERIPTLREVIRLHKKQCDTATQLWIEIKTSPEKPDLTPAPEVDVEPVVKN
ncbi:MAG: glycerophosphodiester phosphodiesterase family protein [Desulfobacterales bacterium]